MAGSGKNAPPWGRWSGSSLTLAVALRSTPGEDSNLPQSRGVPRLDAPTCATPHRPPRLIMRLYSAALLLVIPTVVAAQQVERVTLDGREVAVYNLVGRLRVEGGTGDKVVVEVTR